MTVTDARPAPPAPPAPADAAAILPGSGELAAEYWRLTTEGNRLLDQADALLIRAGLADLASGVQADLARHAASLASIRAELDAAEAEIAPLRAELRECERRRDGIFSASADDALAVKISARSLRNAVVEVMAELETDIHAAETRLRVGELRELADAREADIAGCAAELAELADAAALPFTHPRALETPAYLTRVYSGRTVPRLFSDDRWHAEYDAAYGLMVRLCQVTGFGAAHEARIETGATDPYQAVHNLDGIPWRGRLATPGQVAETARPAVRLPSEVEQANANPFDRGGQP